MPHFFAFALAALFVFTPLARADSANDTALAEHRVLIDGAVPYRITPNFRFFGDDKVHGTLNRLAETAESRLSWMCNQLGNCDRVEAPIDIWVAEDPQAFAKAFPGATPMSEWAAGVAFLKERRIVLRAHGTAVFSLKETFEHELAHVLAHTFAVDGVRWPLWFTEGLAIWLSGESMVERLDAAMKAAAGGALLTPDELTQAFPLEGGMVSVAYAQSAFAVRWAARTAGTAAIITLLHDLGRGTPFDAAFESHIGATPAVAIETGTARIEDSTSFFYHFWDGNLIWGLVTMLFLLVAWWTLKERRTQLARLDEAETARVLAEDENLLATWIRQREAYAANQAEPIEPELLN